MRKILIMNDFIFSGGAEKVMEQISNFLPRNKYKITIMSIANQSEVFNIYYPRYAKYISLNQKFPTNTYSRFSIRHYIQFFNNRVIKPIFIKYLNFKNHDIVIALKEGPCMKFLADFKAKNKLAWIHVDYNCFYWTQNCFASKNDELMCMKKYDNIVCVSQASLDSVKNVVGDSGNLIVRYNPMNIDDIIEKSIKIPEELINLKKDSDGTILVSVGGLRKEKGYIRLLKCCNRLKSKFNFKLLIIGEGLERDTLEEYIDKNNLSKNVILLGNKDNPYPYISNADWFVSSTEGESYGLAIHEALSLKIPVLTTKCHAIEECVSEHEAMLVENDEESLYNGLYTILSDRNLREKYISHIKDRNQKSMYYDKLEEIEKLWL